MSPVPWADARARIEGSGILSGRLSWPNEPFTRPPRAMWAFVEAEGDILEPIEIGPAAVWQEEGRLYIHVIAPLNYGSDEARGIAKQFATLFRAARDMNPAPLVVYTSASIGAGGTDTDGAQWRLTVSIDWRYQDRPE